MKQKQYTYAGDKTRKVTIRVTQEMYDIITGAAERVGMSKTEYITQTLAIAAASLTGKKHTSNSDSAGSGRAADAGTQ